MRHRGVGLFLVAFVVGCSSDEMLQPDEGLENGAGGGEANEAPGGAGGGGVDTGMSPDGATPVALTLRSSTFDDLSARVEQARAQTTEQLLSTYAVPFRSAPLTYDPLEAEGFAQIQSSTLALGDLALERYARDGFAIVPNVRYPSMPYGYFDVYAADLPVFVSADMVLEAVHRSFDSMLKALEGNVLIPELDKLLSAMRSELQQGSPLSPEVAEDADLFIAVATSLLRGSVLRPVTSLAPERISELVKLAEAATGAQDVELFGTTRAIDFSQFDPRGHYTDSEQLQHYFRAMIWLGRTDIRLIETLGTGERVFHRRQVEVALGLRSLMDAAALASWNKVDRTIGAFVGEHDYMVVPELDQLLRDIGSTPQAGLGSVADDVIAQAIIDGQYGEQRIASQLVVKAPGAPATLPLDASFAFFGQRYTVDSHVFSNVVFDRVPTRVLPDPLDVAFAALANDQAAELLSPQLEQFDYAGALGGMRTLADAQLSGYWQSSLYTSWLAALRRLSPSDAGAAPSAEGLPEVARSEAWGRRLLSAQLASWAELRHDTILYAKQSYTAGSVCSYPDAYVDPYPEFFYAIARYAEIGRSLLAELGVDADPYSVFAPYFDNTSRIATILGQMAEAQRTGMPHSPEQIAFINQAIRVESGGSGPPLQTGWYKDLYFDVAGALDEKPTIADVHTDPGGDTPIARGPSVLHVGTGLPRAIVVSVETCMGPRAYAGVVSSYHERSEPGFTRLDDTQWLERARGGPPEPRWMVPLGAP